MLVLVEFVHNFDISNVLEDVRKKRSKDGEAEVDDKNTEDDYFDGESLGLDGGDVTENVAADEDGDEAGEADVHVAEVEAGGKDGADTEGVGEAGEGCDKGDELEEAGDEADAEVEADDDEDIFGDRVVAVQDCQGGREGDDRGEVEGEDGEDRGDPHSRQRRL